MERKIKEHIIRDLNRKMVFVVGPRQAGKTWLAKLIGNSSPSTVYLNYDRREDRNIIDKESWLETTELLILDELHKKKNWKGYLKGVYDTKPEKLKILVTGSARLDTFRQSGDSLAGRFFTHHLLPFTPSEIGDVGMEDLLERLMNRGGFPEPFLAENDTEADRWRMQYIDGLIRHDVLDFEKISDFKAIQLVLDLLRERVGSPVSYSSIARDVGISPNTVKKYLQIFESLFIVFRVTPFSKNIARSLLKEPKIYFFDTAMVKGDARIRFENLTALSLLRHVLSARDELGKPVHLHYLRTKEGHEVDFCLVKDGQPQMIIESKYSDEHLHPSLVYFSRTYKIPAFQVVKQLKRERQEKLIQVRSGLEFLKSL